MSMSMRVGSGSSTVGRLEGIVSLCGVEKTAKAFALLYFGERAGSPGTSLAIRGCRGAFLKLINLSFLPKQSLGSYPHLPAAFAKLVALTEHRDHVCKAVLNVDFRRQVFHCPIFCQPSLHHDPRLLLRPKPRSIASSHATPFPLLLWDAGLPGCTALSSIQCLFICCRLACPFNPEDIAYRPTIEALGRRFAPIYEGFYDLQTISKVSPLSGTYEYES